MTDETILDLKPKHVVVGLGLLGLFLFSMTLNPRKPETDPQYKHNYTAPDAIGWQTAAPEYTDASPRKVYPVEADTTGQATKSRGPAKEPWWP